MTITSPSKREIESKVFEDAVGKARSKGGEGRRNAARISGVREKGERPDFSIITDNGRVIGIEHFAAHQCIRGDKSRQSQIDRIMGHGDKRRRKLVDRYGTDMPLEDMVSIANDMLNHVIETMTKSCIDDIAVSLNERLYGSNGHVHKLAEYRKNLQEHWGSMQVETGFLIEFRSILPKLSLHRGFRKTVLKPGELPLFCNIYDLLEKASNEVDWLIIATYPEISNEIADAAIVRCRNGMFKKSLERQGFTRTEYLGPTLSNISNGSVPEISSEVDSDKVTFSLYLDWDNKKTAKILCDSASYIKKALELKRKGTPFTTTDSVQAWLSSIYPY